MTAEIRLTEEELGALIEAAEHHAEAYDGDDRECIKTDVINAFFAGAAFWQRQVSSGGSRHE